MQGSGKEINGLALFIGLTGINFTGVGCTADQDSNLQTETSQIEDSGSHASQQLDQAGKALVRPIIEKYKNAIRESLQDKQVKNKISSEIGHCMEVSLALLNHLEQKGFKDLELVVTNGNTGADVPVGDKTERLYKHHGFLVDRSLVPKLGNAGEIIIDPSYKQFLTPKPPKLEAVLVGTLTDVKEIYEQYQQAFHLEVHPDSAVRGLQDDPLYGKYTMDPAVDFLYSREKYFANYRQSFP